MFAKYTELDSINLSSAETRAALYLLGWQTLEEYIRSNNNDDAILDSLRRIIFIGQRRYLANGFINPIWLKNLRYLVRHLSDRAIGNLMRKERDERSATVPQCNNFIHVMSSVNNSTNAPTLYINTDIHIAQTVCIFPTLPSEVIMQGEPAISILIKEGKMLAFGSELPSASFFPLLQFRYDGSLIEGLDQTGSYFRGSLIRHINFLLEPNNDLGGSKPIDLLDEGRVAEVAQAAAQSKSPLYALR